VKTAPEPTWVQENFRIPTLFMRFDFSGKVNIDGKEIIVAEIEGIYEGEERPGGAGKNCLISEQFRENWENVLEKWPEFCVVVSPRRESGFDDFVWTKKIYRNPEKVAQKVLLLVRAEPEEVEYHCLVPRSISSLLQKGNKTYGIQFGWWKIADPNDLPWEEPFVLKPLIGSKSRGIEIWHPNGRRMRRKGIGGVSTKKRILRRLKKRDYIIQKWIDPLNLRIGGKIAFGIFRIFLGYQIEKRDWKVIGGALDARMENLRIHGTPETFRFPVLLK